MTPSDWTKKIDQSKGTLFQKQVWKAMVRIPRGKVSTYGGIAHAIGNPKAVRAVGFACNQNPFAPEVPCHRIVSSDGSLGGYAHGPVAKIKLLKNEGLSVANGKIVDFENVLFRFK